MPWEKLPEKVRTIVLYGNDGEKIQFKYENKKKGNKWAWKHAFEGIIPNMQRRYTETAEHGRARRARKYQSTQACATCKGTRLNTAARNVFVQERPLNEIANLSVTSALEFFRALNLAGWRGEIADKIVKEIGNRLKFLADVGPRLFVAGSLRGHAERRRGAAHSARDRRSARGSSASCTSWTSPRSACTSATTSACSTR